MEVTLTWQEQLHALQAGGMRRMSAIDRARQRRLGTPPLDLWGNDIEAAGAEQAVAKYLGIYWQPVFGTPAVLEGDVGDVQVRSTTRPNGRLIVHPYDKDAPFVLVRGRFPAYALAGWIMGEDAKQPQYWHPGDGRAAFFVPARDLAPIELLQAQKKPPSGGYRSHPHRAYLDKSSRCLSGGSHFA